jgi:enoyl-CoA hydratase/carnithine racemase
MVDAAEALRTGLVSAVVDDGELMDRATAMATEIASHAPLAVHMTKRALQINTDAPSFAAAVEVENRNQVITHASTDAGAARANWRQKSDT